MTDDTSYKQWLESNNISRLHPSSRWRIRWVDIQINSNFSNQKLWIGGCCIQDPTEEDCNFIRKWKDSDERRNKKNLVTFLRTAFAARHEIEHGRTYAKEMAGLVRQALYAFAGGRDTEGKDVNRSAWGVYMIVREASHRPLIDKGLSKKVQENALVEGRIKAARNKKDKSEQYHKLWREWATNYLKTHPYTVMKTITDKVKKLADNAGHRMVNNKPYSNAEILKVITGVKNELKNVPIDTVCTQKFSG